MPIGQKKFNIYGLRSCHQNFKKFYLIFKLKKDPEPFKAKLINLFQYILNKNTII